MNKPPDMHEGRWGLSDNFIVDDRSGCIAIRDIRLMGDEAPGLHSDYDSVVWMKSKPSIKIHCPACGHARSDWDDSPELLSEAEAECKKLNIEDERVMNENAT